MASHLRPNRILSGHRERVGPGAEMSMSSDVPVTVVSGSIVTRKLLICLADDGSDDGDGLLHGLSILVGFVRLHFPLFSLRKGNEKHRHDRHHRH